MPVRRFFLATPPSGAFALLEDREAHHLIHVLRAEVGAGVELIDGNGRLWSARVGTILQDRVELVEVALLSEAAEPGIRLTLIQALCKSDRAWPGFCRRPPNWRFPRSTWFKVGVPSSGSPNTGGTQSWSDGGTILTNAAKQSRRTTIPILHPPLECREVCEAVGSDLKLFLQASPQVIPLKRLLRGKSWPSAAFTVGPEGGWTDEERGTFLKQRISTRPPGRQHSQNRDRSHGCGGPSEVRTVSGKLIASSLALH